jgi:hypothetical protein
MSLDFYKNIQIELIILILYFFVFCIIIYFLFRLFTREYEQLYNKEYDKPLVIISLTTSPTRIDHIEEVLNTIMKNTILPDKIVLNLPTVFKRTGLTFNNIPTFITNNPLIYVNVCNDIGPSTKIIASLPLFKNPETILISIDDDILYKPNFIEILLSISKIYPDAVITGISFVSLNNSDLLNDSSNLLNKKYNKLQYVQMVEGYSSVLYKKKFFEKYSVEELENYPKFCYFADDFILSNYLMKEKIRIISTNEDLIENAYLEYGSQIDALKMGANGFTNNNIDNYKLCSNYFKEKNQLYIDYDF